MPFNIDDISTIEFFIQKDNGNFYKIAMSEDTQSILQNMVDNTLFELGNNIDDYSPSEKYNSGDKLKVTLNSRYCGNLLEIYNDNDISVDNQQIIHNPEDIIYYFCRLTDSRNETLLAIKKATYFKAVTAQHNIFIQWFNDRLIPFSGSLFKLDKSFDILIYDETVYINKYLVFESIADMGETVRLASCENIRLIEQTSPIVIFSDESKEYIKNHIMAARPVASIKSSGRLNNLSLDELIEECQKQNILINVENGQVTFNEENTMNFLKLIDRRLFVINLTGEDEKYEAKSRQER